MRILYVSGEPLRPRQAAETHVTEIVKNLQKIGHEIRICTAAGAGTYERTSIWKRIVAYIAFWRSALVAIRQAPRCDVIYARAHPANLPIAIVARFARIPIVHEINGYYFDVSITHPWLRPLNRLIAATYRWQYRRGDALIVVTAGLAEWVSREVPGKIVETVSNAANCSIFRLAELAEPLRSRNYALFFGSMTRWHGIEILVAAVSDQAWPSNLDLVLIGDGQLVEFLRSLPTRQSAAGIIHLPSVPQTTLASYINGAKVGLVPSNSVNGRAALGLSPLKLYEMLACGLPVVVTDFPGQADLVRSLQAGIVVPPDNAEALARAVARLYTSPPSHSDMSRVAEHIRTNHRWEDRSRQIADVLARVAHQASMDSTGF